MAELTEATDVVAEVADSVADEATHVAEVSRALDPRELRLFLVGLGVGLVGGAVAGGLVANRRLRLKYEQVAEDEIDEMREHFRARLLAKEEKPNLTAMTKKAETIAQDEGYSAPNTPKLEEVKDAVVEEEVVEEVVVEEVEEDAPEEEVVRNVFEADTGKDPDDDWDYAAETAARNPKKPYIIHVDEQHESDYPESSLVYYEGDDVLCSEDDSVIEDKEAVVGVENLNRFGHGSGDKNVLYIRNDVLGIEVEVVKNDGNYAEVVHGFVQHSDVPSRRRHRKFDDDPHAA